MKEVEDKFNGRSNLSGECEDLPQYVKNFIRLAKQRSDIEEELQSQKDRKEALRQELSMHEGSVLQNGYFMSPPGKAATTKESVSSSSKKTLSSGPSSGGDITDNFISRLITKLDDAQPKTSEITFQDEVLDNFIYGGDIKSTYDEESALKSVGIGVISVVFQQFRDDMVGFRKEMIENLPRSFDNSLLISKLFVYLKQQ